MTVSLTEIQHKLQTCISTLHVIEQLQQAKAVEQESRQLNMFPCTTQTCIAQHQSRSEDHEMEIRKEIQKQRHHLLGEIETMNRLIQKIAA